MMEPLGTDKPRFVPTPSSDESFESIHLTRDTISSFLAWAAHLPIGRRDLIRRRIAQVAGDDGLVQALCDELLVLDDVDPVRHFALLSTIGETRNALALPALGKLIWHARPSNGQPHRDCGCRDASTTDLLGGLQARAVEMVAYIGGEGAHAIVFDVLARHPARATRIAAIDAYLYNHGDSDAARERLRATVQPADAKFVGLPRFTRETDRRTFDAKVARFYRDHPHERPPVPSTVGPRTRSDDWHRAASRVEPGPQA